MPPVGCIDASLQHSYVHIMSTRPSISRAPPATPPVPRCQTFTLQSLALLVDRLRHARKVLRAQLEGGPTAHTDLVVGRLLRDLEATVRGERE